MTFTWINRTLFSLVLIFSQNSLAESTFDSFCKKGQQIKKLNERITVLLPRTPSGVPLDIVQKDQKRYRSNARRLMRELFLYKPNVYGQSTTWENTDLSKKLEFYRNDEKVNLSWAHLQSLKILHNLYEEYTFRIPLKTQKNLFNSGRVPRRYFRKQCITHNDVFYGHVGFLGLNGDCKFSASAMIKDKVRAWEALKYEYTSVKESPSKDPRELKFEIELDLSLLCKYGIKTEDLYSK